MKEHVLTERSFYILLCVMGGGGLPGREDNIWIQVVKMGKLLLKRYKSMKNLPFKSHVLDEISPKKKKSTK